MPLDCLVPNDDDTHNLDVSRTTYVSPGSIGFAVSAKAFFIAVSVSKQETPDARSFSAGRSEPGFGAPRRRSSAGAV